MVWELTENGVKSKIELSFNDIVAIQFNLTNAESVMVVELGKPPKFYKEIPQQSKKATAWGATPDFTGNQATTCRRHIITFGKGVLSKHYEKLVSSDSRIKQLSEIGVARTSSPYFSGVGMNHQLLGNSL
jgi:hypothetical protein